ncbi:MAG: cytochrome P450 [Nitrosomonas ureae]
MIAQAPPGPRGWPWLGSLPSLAKNTLDFWKSLAECYGPVVRYRIGTEQHFLINDPAGIAHVFKYDTIRYYRGKYHDFLKPAFGEGLLTTNGECWRQQRRLTKPAFSKHRVTDWFSIVVDTTTARIVTWAKSQPVSMCSIPLDMASEMASLIQEINAKILFGRRLPYQANPELLTAVNIINDSLLRQIKRAMFWDGFLNRLPLSDARHFHQAVTMLHQTVDDLIAHASANKETENSLSMLLARGIQEGGVSSEEPPLRDRLITLFLAGHETTAVALAWIFYYLTEHPQWAACLHEEIMTIVGNRPLSVEDLSHLTQTQWVINESLRLRPPVYGIGRRARVDDEVSGYFIPAESPIVISPYVMHHHPAYWEHPERFDPNRFSPDCTINRPAFSYFPFGGGPHVCIGRHLGMMELLTVVALVIQACRLTAPPKRCITLQPWITLRPKPGIPVLLAYR